MKNFYLSANQYFQTKYNIRIKKISLDIGRTCPNRDGNKGIGGCVYCSENGSGSRNTIGATDLIDQIDRGWKYYKKRHSNEKFIAYFQSFTPTYGPLPELKKHIETVFTDQRISGFVLSSRSDTFDKDTAEMLAFYQNHNNKKFFWLELGLQSIHQKSLNWMNRCETLADFEKAFSLAQEYNLPVVLHLILFLPTESNAEMLETIKYVAKIRPWGVKLHQLHPVPKTRLWRMWQKEQIPPLQLHHYLSGISSALELLPTDMVIHRVVANNYHSTMIFDGEQDLRKEKVIHLLHKYMLEKNTWQGKYFK